MKARIEQLYEILPDRSLRMALAEWVDGVVTDELDRHIFNSLSTTPEQDKVFLGRMAAMKELAVKLKAESAEDFPDSNSDNEVI